MKNLWWVILAVCAISAVGVYLFMFAPPGTQQLPSPRLNNSQTTVVAVGDIACPPNTPTTTIACRQADIAALTVSMNPSAVLALGDLQYPDGRLDYFQQSFDTSWRPLKAILKPVPGNHEYRTPGASGYYDYFGTAAGERGQGYYSFDLGNWHLVALNSELDVGVNSAQRTWLRADLAKSTLPCTLAYWHKPRFSTGTHISDAAFAGLWQDLYAAGAEVVLSGHSHDYERFVPLTADGVRDDERGIVQIVSGMGGYGPEELHATVPTLVTRQNSNFGVVRLDLFLDSLQYQFVSAPGSAAFSDAGTITCHD